MTGVLPAASSGRAVFVSVVVTRGVAVIGVGIVKQVVLPPMVVVRLALTIRGTVKIAKRGLFAATPFVAVVVVMKVVTSVAAAVVGLDMSPLLVTILTVMSKLPTQLCTEHDWRLIVAALKLVLAVAAGEETVLLTLLHNGGGTQTVTLLAKVPAMEVEKSLLTALLRTLVVPTLVGVPTMAMGETSGVYGPECQAASNAEISDEGSTREEFGISIPS